MTLPCSEVEAALAYDHAVRRLNPSKADKYTNFPVEASWEELLEGQAHDAPH